MRLRDLTIWIVCLTLASGLIITAGSRLDNINQKRKQMNLIRNEPLENAPPSLAFATVAMGAFRGLVVDILWMRADRLKEEGQFFDAKQLAEWITTLQPRFAEVWEFHAWNMAYNISVCLPATEADERWRWVKNGYELLRDKGILLNPTSIRLYRQLALIFQHKIGGVTDEAHKYYKLQLAKMMQPLLGDATNEYFKKLEQAPKTWKKISNDPDVESFILALKNADQAFDGTGNDFVQKYLSLRQNPDRFNPRAFRTIEDFRGSPALQKFDIFAKAYHLRHKWSLDPNLMNQLNQKYGPVNWDEPDSHLPLDWRHPDTHAIYWAVLGLKKAGKEEFSIDETNTDRIVGHSLQNLFRNGKIFIYRTQKKQQNRYAEEQPLQSEEIFLRPDLRMFNPYNEAMLAVLEKYEDIGRKGTLQSLKNGHRNMLKNAVLSFYQAGLKAQARKIFKEMKQRYTRDEFKGTLAGYIKRRLKEELQFIGLFNAKEAVILQLREAYFRYAVRDDERAYYREKWAKEIYNHYQSSYRDENRIDLEDFDMLKYVALIDFLNDNLFSAELRQRLLTRIRIEKPQLWEKLNQQREKLMKKIQQENT